MSFKFVARNLETGLTGAVTVKAASEPIARQKLQVGGYEVVRLMRVSNGQEASIRLHVTEPVRPQTSSRTFQTPSKSFLLKLKVSAYLHDFFRPFAF